MGLLNVFKNSGKIHIGNISKIGPLAFKGFISFVDFARHLNLATSYWLFLELPGQICPFNLEVGSPFSSSHLVFSIVALLLSHGFNISCEAISMMDAMMQSRCKK